jgi:hypothetical protein
MFLEYWHGLFSFLDWSVDAGRAVVGGVVERSWRQSGEMTGQPTFATHPLDDFVQVVDDGAAPRLGLRGPVK